MHSLPLISLARAATYVSIIGSNPVAFTVYVSVFSVLSNAVFH